MSSEQEHTKGSKPYLLIDVDGVLCPFSEGEGYVQHEVAVGIGGWVYVSEKNKERLKQLSDLFTLVWATAWEDAANEHLLEVHGLPAPLPVIYFDHRHSREDSEHYIEGYPEVKRMSGWSMEGSILSWKLPFIRAWADHKAAPLAFVDDDNVDRDTIAWARDRTESGIPTLAIAIDPDVGLSDEDVEALVEFAQSLDN